MSIFSKLFGSNESQIKKYYPIVEKINILEEEMKSLTEEEIKAKTQLFQKFVQSGEKSLDEILPEAFALTREVARRTLGERAHDVQLIGGMILHSGKIAEMKTGEGKTLTSVFPIYLNALTGKGVHLVTVNDYLAKRDCNWMGVVYKNLGLSVGCITHEGGYIYEPKSVDRDEVDIEMENLQLVSKKQAYNCDITYGTNNEFGFDYLRDNMARTEEQLSQRELNFAIVDEVDSILIDEARTPLIISAPDTESTKLYDKFAQIVPKLVKDEDFSVDEKLRNVSLTEKGIEKVENLLGVGNIYEEGKIQYVHHLEQSLKAFALFEKDKDYIVRDGEVVIIDEFTGRAMEGRRYSDGLHQAIEAKEKVEVQRESKTLATITFQNYFRMYSKLAGMTGTAITSAEEFQKVYKLDVIVVPTNKKMIRTDLPDVVYKNNRGKFKAIVEKIKELHKNGQPVLVGTVAIEKSELLSEMLLKEKISHSVLNAKYHEKEAQIIAKAGLLGAVTIATNMAGRGTDIKLGEGAKEVGGLYIIGTERHEARRIDNQLRGRAGRQGDPGTTQFYISLDDELMRRFGGDRLKGLMEKIGFAEDQPIENRIISKQIESAQSKIEGFNFDTRKHVLDYDDVVNKQREKIYEKRRALLMNESNSKEEISKMLEIEISEIVLNYTNSEKKHNWEVAEILKEIKNITLISENVEKKITEILANEKNSEKEIIEEIKEFLISELKSIYLNKEIENGGNVMRIIEKSILLQTIDQHWMNHLDAIEHMRQGIGLRGYGQQDPLIEYKKEAFGMYTQLLANIRNTTLRTIFRASLVSDQSAVSELAKNMTFSGAVSNPEQFANLVENEQQQFKASLPKIQQPMKVEKMIGRNDLCSCGSGKKYKKCCGK